MVQTPYKTLTLEEFLALPETEPASEYIDGQILQKTIPQAKHSLIQLELANAINALTRPQKIALALPELRCTCAERSFEALDDCLPVPAFAQAIQLTVGELFWLKVSP
jgi:Uma2 family endonuclease